MAKKKKSYEELEIENKYIRRSKIADRFASIANNIIKWVGIVAIFYISFLIINVLAGRNTSAEFRATLSTNFFDDTIIKLLLIITGGGILFGYSGIMYGMGERKIKKDVIERFESQLREKEKQIDKNRSSSKLNSNGETRKEDL